MKVSLVIAVLALAACASREPRPDNLIVLQPDHAEPELDVPLNPRRPGGPLDIKPGDAWSEPTDGGASVRAFPMSPGGTQTPTENPMPGAIVPR
jgi:hypothetical protein